MTRYKNILSISILAVLIGVGYIKEGRTGEITISNANVYFSETAKGEVSLYSPNVEVRITKFSYCGAPVKGAKEYSGDFYFSFGESKLSLGKMYFAENTYHDGNFIIKQLDTVNLRRDFIVILQYGTCSWEFARFYRYDFKNQALEQYHFKWHNENKTPEIALSLTKGELLEILPNKDFISRSYDNSIGKFRMSK